MTQTAGTVTGPEAEPPKVDPKSLKDRIFVYKYDGSLQCKQGKALTPQEMARELKNIKVFSMESRYDGLMHIQACGTITGQANVYEIPKSDLATAEERGFKEWNF